MIHFLRRLFQIVRSTRSETAQLAWVVVLVALLIGYGSGGFYLFERDVHDPPLTYGDCVWWSVVTMTTVGYGDFYPVTWEGRWLISAPVMVLGIGVLGYAIGLLTTMVIERHSRESKGMLPYDGDGHVIICNYPSEPLVLEILEEIQADAAWRERGLVLVTDALEELPEPLRRAGVHFVRGSPSREASLERAGLARANSVMVLAQDALNPDASDNLALGILVTVRALRPDVYVVVECIAEENVKLLRNAGANEIVGLGLLSAELLVQGLQDPGVSGVLGELLSNRTGHQIYIAPVVAFRGTFEELEQTVRGLGRYVILGLIDPDGARRFAPDPATRVEPGHKLMLIGDVRPKAL